MRVCWKNSVIICSQSCRSRHAFLSFLCETQKYGNLKNVCFLFVCKKVKGVQYCFGLHWLSLLGQ